MDAAECTSGETAIVEIGEEGECVEEDGVVEEEEVVVVVAAAAMLELGETFNGATQEGEQTLHDPHIPLRASA